MSAPEWWRAFEINVGGAFVLSQLVLPGMVAAGSGRIVNITSYAGVYRWPLMSAYAASKAALVKLTETLAEETRPWRVRVQRRSRPRPIGVTDAALQSRAGSQNPRALSTAGSVTSCSADAAPSLTTPRA